MSSTQDTRSTPQASEGFTGPGSQLRRARENHQLSINAVAAQLHVRPKIIIALEADDYASLSSPVFVRGYLRSYARVVSLSPEPLIESYNRGAGDEAVLATIEPEDAEERPMRWSIYLGVLAGLAVAVVWVNRQGLEQYWAGSISTAESTAPSPAAPQVKETENLEEAPAAPPPPSLAENPAETPAPETAGAAPSPPPAVPAAAIPAPQPAGDEAAATTVGHGPDQLTVRISKDSWVAIRDASGQRLIYGNLTAGTVKTIRGEAPFALVLGNASAAQVEFNGQSVDHSKYTTGAVARFKILK